MITNKKINVIIAIIMAAAVLLTTLAVLFYPATGTSAMASQMAYTAIFDRNSIMTMDISVDEESWNAMLENATAEEYILCDIAINGTLYTSVGIRPKGNTSPVSYTHLPIGQCVFLYYGIQRSYSLQSGTMGGTSSSISPKRGNFSA